MARSIHVTLALAGTFGYYHENGEAKDVPEKSRHECCPRVGHLSEHQSSELKKITGELTRLPRGQILPIGFMLWDDDFDFDNTSSSHIPSMRGEGAGEPSMDIPRDRSFE